ncbi:MAG: hypothetical protein LBR22_06765 [Desulfovibrio sp.]|jgi:hypothetical protein|nr:hypothetical protein [Desulfovibrio sp.]
MAGSSDGRLPPTQHGDGDDETKHRGARIIPFSEARAALEHHDPIPQAPPPSRSAQSERPDRPDRPDQYDESPPPDEESRAVKSVSLPSIPGYRYVFKDDDVGGDIVEALRQFARLTGVGSRSLPDGIALGPPDEAREQSFFFAFVAAMQTILSRNNSDLILELNFEETRDTFLYAYVHRFDARIADETSISALWFDRLLQRWRDVPLDTDVVAQIQDVVAQNLNILVAHGGALSVESFDPRCGGELKRIRGILEDEESDAVVVCGFQAHRCIRGCSIVEKTGIRRLSMEQIVREWYDQVRDDYLALLPG